LRDHDDGLQSLMHLPFQPLDRLADVTGAADSVVAILEPKTGAFSVPSKVLTYLAAGRPIVVTVPQENPAARLMARSGARVVVLVRDPRGLSAACVDLLARTDERVMVGMRGRAHAESAFEINQKADQVEALMSACPIHGRLSVARGPVATHGGR
jgi:colanic acid biosynthesis glycosyl transferase WcaI